MKSCPFIPVAFDTNHGYIYTRKASYALEFLETAYSLLESGQPMPDDTIAPVTDIVAAYHYAQIAKENMFSFHPIFGLKSDCEIAFVSDQFDGILIVIDALTLDIYFITQFWQQDIIKDLVNTWVEDAHLYYLLKAYHGISTNPKNFVKAVIVNRDTPEEYMSVAPYLLPEYCHNSVFEKEYYDSLAITYNTLKPSKYFKVNIDQGCITSQDDYEYYTMKDVQRIGVIHDYVYATKSDYIELFSTDSGDVPRFYIAKDFKHIVDSNTFRDYQVSYQTLQKFLRSLVDSNIIKESDISDLVEILEKLYGEAE